MQPQDLFHLLTNGFYRVERITGILRDQADAHSAQAIQAYIRPVANHFAIEDNPPGIPAGVDLQRTKRSWAYSTPLAAKTIGGKDHGDDGEAGEGGQPPGG